MDDGLTPAMRQFMEIKRQNKDCILFFRMGDFYETFFDDAKLAARELDITLTKRGKKGKIEDIPLAGVPYHAAEQYIGKLVRKGYKVAIVEQMEDPKLAKGLVKRDLVKIITPGTIIESNLLDKSNNYLMAIAPYNGRWGLSFLDISTGEFLVTEVDLLSDVKSEMFKFDPAEILVPSIHESDADLAEALKDRVINYYGDFNFYFKNCEASILEHFKIHSLDSLGLSERQLSVSAAGALLAYVAETQKKSLEHLRTPRLYSIKDYMELDPATIRNLELFDNLSTSAKGTSLIDIIDSTVTSMGSRMMKEVVMRPLVNAKMINQRLSAVKELVEKPFMKEDLIEHLKEVRDIERIVSRINYGNSNPRDLISLKQSLKALPGIKGILSNAESHLLTKLNEFTDLKDIQEKIESTIQDDPPALLTNGGIIKEGLSKDLDEIRDISRNAKKYIRSIEEKEKEATGIKSLKIRYNKVFGYYIEINRTNASSIPQNYIRKQTLVNAERFITPELKEKEETILGAEDKIISMEQDIFASLTKEISGRTQQLQEVARSLAYIDVICSFAVVALKNSYKMPEVGPGYNLEIINGRHPVIETITDFVPNDTVFNPDVRMMIITGPNMAGKSTYMRQVALIVLMAQVGSFVPATKAKIGIVDKVFTRIGASDDLSRGQSTFLVEMSQTANILNNATDRSLIVLDEIGRGTSTFDGISIAWAVAEYIAKTLKSKTLFATHYHVLNSLHKEMPGIRNFNIAVGEEEDRIVFLRKIMEGGTDKSYGIEVAKIAGLPQKVIERSREIQFKLEAEDMISEKIVVETKKRPERKYRKEVEEISSIVKSRQMKLTDMESDEDEVDEI